MEKALLLYSGGLDTSCMLTWIQEQYDADVVALTLDVGQQESYLEEVKEKALKLGAVEAFVEDVKDDFVNGYIKKSIKANGLYQEQYPLSTALARPLMSEVAIEYAKKTGSDAIVHGSTGKGNDQVRFEVSLKALAKDIEVLAPVRKWNMDRDAEIEYAKLKNIPIPVDVKSPYSTDENLWGRSIECGVLEDPAEEPPSEIFKFTTPIDNVPDEPEYITLEFEEGVPVALNGSKMELKDLIIKLNDIAGKHGVGVIDMVEDRVVGLKSREIYECPAAVTIIKAHKELEKYCSTRHQNEFKPLVDKKWSEMVYQGLYLDPLMDNLQAYIDNVNEGVKGSVKMKLFKGRATVTGRESEEGLYEFSLATYDKDSTFDQGSSVGFIDIWGLPTKVSKGKKLTE